MSKRRNLRKEKAERNKIYARKFRKVSRRRFSGRGKGRGGMGMGQGTNSEQSDQSEQSGQSSQSSQNTYNS